MKFVGACSSCAGPVTIKMVQCPHCQARNPIGMVARAVSGVVAVVGGFTVSSTLAACYGAPCADPGDPHCRQYIPRCDEVSMQSAADDKDKDGYCKSQDCDENDPKRNAAAHDIPGDAIDQNCDGSDTPK